MKSRRKFSYFERLRIILTLLMLFCFEKLSVDQHIMTCQLEKRDTAENTHLSTHSRKPNYGIDLFQSPEVFHNLKLKLMHAELSRLEGQATLFKNETSLTLYFPSLKVFQPPGTSVTGRLLPSCHYRTGNTQCGFHHKAPESKWKVLVPKEATQGDTNNSNEYSHCYPNENATTPLHHADIVITEQRRSSTCSLHRATVALVNGRIFLKTKTPRKTNPSSSGKRCRRLGSRSWNVDAVPNPKGQAQRNSLKLQISREELSNVEQNGEGKSGNRSLVDLLLMSEHQRTGFSEAGGGSILMQLLVSLATIMLVLGDHSRQKKEQKSKYRLHLLLPRLGAYNRTARMNTDTHNKRINTEPCPLESFGRNAGHQNSQDEGNEVVAENARTSQSHESHSLKEKGRHFSDSESPGINIFQQTLAWVCPATAFLPSMTSADSNFLDHVGYRLASLAALPSSCSLSRVRLADAGFHFNPRTNRSAVVCHKCGAALSLDTSTQDATFTSPLAFHRQSSPRCPFLASVLDQFTEMPLGSATAQQEYDSSAVAARQPSCELSASSTQPTPVSSASRQVGGTNHADGRDLSEDSDGILPAPTNSSRPATGYTLALSNTTADRPSTGPQQSRQTPPAGRQVRDSAEERPHLDLGSAVYPQFSTAQSRLATFQNWPLLNVFLPQTLVSLGFYYAGYADCVRCFYCGVGLKSWDENDDPLVEHVRWRPQCVYLLATKGRQHIHSVINRTGNTGGHDDSEVQATTLPQRQQRQTAPTLNISRTGQAAVRDGPVARTGSDLSVIRQQLLVMGFSAEDIDRAQERLGSTGGSNDLDRLLATLIPE